MHNPENTGATLVQNFWIDITECKWWIASLGNLHARLNYQKPQIFLRL